MGGEDIYRRPLVSFADRFRESRLYVEERITKNLIAATDSDNVTEFLVKLIYGENFKRRLPEVKIKAYSSQVLELADALEQVQPYGKFSPPALSCQLQYLYHKGYVAEARFGRENSPVIYIKPPHRNQQTIESSHHMPRRQSEHDTIKTEILQSLRRLNPDELEEYEAYGIRAWWR